MRNKKYIRAVAVSMACTVVAAVIMIAFQTINNNNVENSLVDKSLTEIPAQLDSESQAREALIYEYDRDFQTDLAAIRYLMETDGQKSAFDRINAKGVSAEGFFLVRKDGIILNGTDKGSIGHRITDICPLSPDEYELVMEGEGYVNTGLVRLADGTPIKVFAVAFEGARLVMPAILKGKYASVYSLDDMSGLFGPVDERLFVTSIDNGTLLFGPLKTEAADFSGQPISVLNLDESVTREPSAGHSKVMGYGYKYRTIQYESDIFGSITILAAYTDEGAVPAGALAVLLITIMLIIFLIQIYSSYIDEEHGKLQIRAGGLKPFGKKGCAVDAEKARILMPFALVCIVFVTVAGFYLNSLNMIGNQIWTSQWNISQVSENLGKIDKKLSDNFDAASEDVAAFLKITASVLEDHQADLLVCRESSRLKEVEDKDGTVRLVEICNPWLAGMAQAQSARDISVFDKKGRLIATSGTQTNLGFSRDDEATSSLFNVIDGVSSSEQMMNEDNFIVCAPFSLRREGKVSDAMLVTRFKINPAHWNSILESIRSTFNAASESGHCHYLMTSAGEGHKVIYSAKVLGNIAADLSDAAYKDGYLGFHKAGNTRYCVATKQVSGNKGEYFIMSFVPLGDVYLGRTASCIGTFAVTLLIVLVFLGILLIYGPGKVARLKEAARKEMEERKSMTAIQLEKMDVEMKKVPTSSQRILGVMGKIWIVILAFISLSLVIGLSTGPSETLSGYLMSFLWQRGVNIFSLTTMIVITLSFAFGMFILARIMSVLKSALNAGAETVCQLLVSLLRYAGYISVVFVTLYMFGVDTTGVLASLGAFSVMVGLGAKNLITDILAGVSIIMENDYKVGDIV
ncbi:MAG: mechanosensitive ion channel family protein, partial [Bacteroidales bacterium]|nr:mechanosensitive ion channel family protein [Bacteroidales bacterium]